MAVSICEVNVFYVHVSVCRPKAYYLCDLIDYFYRCMRYERIMTTYINPIFLYVDVLQLFLHFVSVLEW